jgi:tetratricopeptide (TPR) repeat protein
MEGQMKRVSLSILVLLAAVPALAAGDMSGMTTADNPSDMGGMAMKMTLPPMPAIYAGVPDRVGAPLFEGYGDHVHKITTSNPKTQEYFNQGVRLLFGFNHAEAIRSFREAARLDPDCAMCWWGVAFALGPNINLPMQPDAVGPAWAAVQMARSLEPKASPEEVAWIEALAARYAQNPPQDRHPLDEAFASAMAKVWHDYPNDLDAGVFYAESMMDTQPWDYWMDDAKTPKGHGADIVATIESVLQKEPLHPGALHLYIHAVEASSTPDRAEAAADKLEPLMPGSGHLVHMPSHIYFRVGRYEDAVKVNTLAAEKDEAYIAACKAQGFYPLAYYSHNIHFLWTSSEMLGRYKAAQDAARRVIKASDAGVPMAAGIPPVQLYRIVPIVTAVRFGKWNDVLAMKMPPPDQKLTTAIYRYARAFAYANKHDFKRAAKERAALAAMIAKKEFAAIDAFPVPGTQMAELGLTLVDGEVARQRGHLDKALAYFKKANELYEAIPYTEPDYWYQPVSHIYGAALLQAHKPAEAEAVYRHSLTVHRIDGWALFGLEQALRAQHKTVEANKVHAEFAKAWSMADVKLASSRF